MSEAADNATKLLRHLTAAPHRAKCVKHVEKIPPHSADFLPIPEWVQPELAAALRRQGITQLYSHQAEAADLAHRGQDVVLATGTASGKSLAYQLPVLQAIADASRTQAATAIYISPTKALAADQITSVRQLAKNAGIKALEAATYDGDTPSEIRRSIREHANLIFTNPDMLHHAIMPGHAQWRRFWKGLRYVVIDECHAYRGVFGAHVAQVLRRLRRIATFYGANPTFILASATTANPENNASSLIGKPVRAVTTDGSPQPGLTFVLWDPVDPEDEVTRRSCPAETAALLGECVAEGAQCIAFTRSRRNSEIVAAAARRGLRQQAELSGQPRLIQMADAIAAYRGGYLASERRALEAGLREGKIRALASTNALELGIDISALDVVLISGWPGTRASLWQQAGRAGRRDKESLVIFIAREDPLDNFVVNNPQSVFGQSVEASVFDPDNPYILMPHLLAAAAELPIKVAELGATEVFSETTGALLDRLVAQGALRKRPQGWIWPHPEPAHSFTQLRGAGETVRIVETDTGRLIGTIDAGSSHEQVHDGAIYIHQNETFLIQHLDVEQAVAFAVKENPLISTQAQSTSEVGIKAEDARFETQRGVVVSYGAVEVNHQVTGYQTRDIYTTSVLGSYTLDLPERRLITTACWWAFPTEIFKSLNLAPDEIPGTLHAAEHALISMLPLIAVCDRWDIGGLSIDLHPDTELPSIFIYDGHQGGAGFAQRGYKNVSTWIKQTADMVAACTCVAGCPACVVSPKCGNGNNPLHKAGAIKLLAYLAQDLQLQEL